MWTLTNYGIHKAHIRHPPESGFSQIFAIFQTLSILGYYHVNRLTII